MWNDRWMLLVTLVTVGGLLSLAPMLSSCKCEECDCDDDTADDDDNADDDDADDDMVDDDSSAIDDDDSGPSPCGAIDLCQYEIDICGGAGTVPDCVSAYQDPANCPTGNGQAYVVCRCGCLDSTADCSAYDNCGADCYTQFCE